MNNINIRNMSFLPFDVSNLLFLGALVSVTDFGLMHKLKEGDACRLTFARDRPSVDVVLGSREYTLDYSWSLTQSLMASIMFDRMLSRASSILYLSHTDFGDCLVEMRHGDVYVHTPLGKAKGMFRQPLDV